NKVEDVEIRPSEIKRIHSNEFEPINDIESIFLDSETGQSPSESEIILWNDQLDIKDIEPMNYEQENETGECSNIGKVVLNEFEECLNTENEYITINFTFD
ncbi:8797_t:CDS:1, partial [Racocetra fulgida]